ncbi:MAG: tRNA pseudouridine(54/55) synthase Pus10, partial [Thermoplasmatota archaeon]
MLESGWLQANSAAIMRIGSMALGRPLCDHCLGRLFARSGFGLTNEERGRAVRIVMALSAELLSEESKDGPPDLLSQLPVHHSPPDIEDDTGDLSKDDGWTSEPTPSFDSYLSDVDIDGGCYICQDLFRDLDALAALIMERIDDQEFRTFQVGTKVDPGTAERERLVWELTEPTSAEPIKEEINREVGKILGPMMPDKEFSRDDPEVTFIIDPIFRVVKVQRKPLFIYGRYNKFVRGIPQTRWECKKCRGRGCTNCNGKGKMYEISVEELIGGPFLKEAGAANFKLHGMGREDIDVKCLGTGRPFILEISEPAVRTLDIDAIGSEIGHNSGGKVEVRDLRQTSRSEVALVKEGSSLKRYSAVISVKEGLDEEILKYNISLLAQSPISQRTPKRVSHRRADLVRERHIHEIEARTI